MFVFREVKESDIEGLHELAQHLGAVGNLPLDLKLLKLRVQHAVQSFKKPDPDKSKNIYMFVLEDFHRKIIVGSSLIFAKHGSEGSPHTYLQVLKKVRSDPSTDTSIEHQILRFEFDTDGPSEIGGLILHPDYRSSPAGLGKQLSYARFVYMGMFPQLFEDNVIAELLPPFNDDGSSELWEAFGRRFTGMSYQEADLLSRTDKDFITNLFPSEDIYTCLFSPKAISVIGQTGESTTAAKRLLEKIGMTYLHSVDPFDGGPHFGSKLMEVSLIKRMRKCSVEPKVMQGKGKRGLLGFHGNKGFGCLYVHFKSESSDTVQISADAKEIVESYGAPLEEVFLVSPV